MSLSKRNLQITTADIGFRQFASKTVLLTHILGRNLSIYDLYTGKYMPFPDVIPAVISMSVGAAFRIQ